MSTVKRKKVVVIGGGFAGVNVIKSLAKDSRFQVTLVDKNNYHFFPPLLYQVSTAFIEPSNISYPFRRMFQGQENVRFHMGSMLSVNPEDKTVETDTGVLEYDYLVIAHGTESNYFGMENVKNNSLPMKTIDDALNLRNYLLLNMEKAIRMIDPVAKERMLNIVIAGGGPTGVEVAGMLAEMGGNIAKKEYPEIRNMKSHIYLIDAAPVLLGPMSKKSQNEAYEVLSDLGVKIILNTAVKDYTDGQVILGDGTSIHTNVFIWTSGVIGREVPGLPKEAVTRGRRLVVDQLNQVKGLEGIYAVGDISFMDADANFPQGHPQLAQVAMQQGTLLGANLKRIEEGETPQTFSYHDKGSMAIISKFHAVADLPKVFFKGFFAWVVWLLIHLIPLVGFRNKARLAASWMWSFLTNDPTLRLILRPKSDKEKG